MLLLSSNDQVRQLKKTYLAGIDVGEERERKKSNKVLLWAKGKIAWITSDWRSVLWLDE